jgi:GTPase
VVEVETGIHPMDLEIAQYLRRAKRPVLLVVNKADHLPDETRQLAFYELGLGDPFPVSAAVGKNSGDLLDKVASMLPESPEVVAENVIHVAVVGRPNVGKSSLVNRLLGQERHIVAAEPGTTRDAIDTQFDYQGRKLVFIDTAGLRKRSKVEEDLEFYSTLRTSRAMERAEVCVLVVDAKDGMHVQDLKIANEAWDRGAGVIIAVNKWDLIEEKVTNTARDGERDIKARAPFLEFIPFFYVSAKTGQRVPKLLDAIVTVADEREKRVPTAEVNRVLEQLLARQQPPQPVGESVRLFYATQVGTAPPRFAVVANRPEAIPESYTRYLHNGFREAWEFTGAPLTIKFRRKRGRR